MTAHLCLLVWRGSDDANFFQTGWAWNLRMKGKREDNVHHSQVLNNTSCSRSGSGVRGLLSGNLVSVDVKKVRLAA